MKKIADFFKFEEKQTSLKTEILAGCATFLTMAYIIVVNPSILSNGGMSFAGVMFATIIVSAVSCILMGFYTNLPFALAPGMGLNAFVAFTLIQPGKVTWQTAMGAVFISGLIFILLSLFKVREKIVAAIPASLRYSIAAGIGFFLALIGLTQVGFVVHKEYSTIVQFGGITPQVLLFLFGLVLTGFLVIKKVKGDLVIGIAATSIAALIVSLIYGAMGKDTLVTLPKELIALPSFDVFLKLDIKSALSLGMILPIFTLVFTDMFDSISTFLGVSEVGGFIDKKTGQPQNVGKALLVDAVSTTISGLAGTSSGTTFIESAAGVEEGGKTGVTAIVTGLLFLPFMFFSPLLSFIPAAATSPILVLIGLFMMKPLLKIRWGHFEEAIPAFLAMLLIPLTFSITQGIIWGFLSYTILKVLLGKFKEIPITLWVIDLFAVLSLVLSSVA